MKNAAASVTALFLASVFGVGCSGEGPDDLGILEVSDPGELKADGVKRLFIHESMPFKGQNTRTTKVFTSSAQFVDFFGQQPPESIDFDHEWALYYAPGVQPSGGYSASITRAQLSESKRTVTFWTELGSPGNDCFTTQALTSPGTLATIRKPGPETTHFSTRTQSFTHRCSRVCGAELTAQLEYGSRGAFYLSEADEPYTPVSFASNGLAEVTADNVRELTNQPADAAVDESDWNEFIESATSVDPDDDDDFLQELAKDMAELRDAAEMQLEDLKVFDIGAEPSGDGVRPLFIIGKDACGDFAGYVTTIVAT